MFFCYLKKSDRVLSRIKIIKEGKNECQNFKNIRLWVIFLGLERPFMGETRQ
ncbi:hypothetical protein ckin24_07260 [Helicobacter pylori]